MQNIWSKIKKPILALAPMAGYTDSAFRLICLENGADIVYTEMTSVEAIWRKNKKTLKMLELLPKEKNVILQLFGNKPESFKKALKTISKIQPARPSGGFPTCPSVRRVSKISGIDINLGCPAHKVTKTGSGAALMDNKQLARKIIQTVLENTKLPVSIKMRSQVKNTSAIDFIKYIKDLNISAVMIHCRSLKQKFSGPVDFSIIKKIKKLLPNIPILTNGGINTPEQAKNILEKTNVNGIGIARGSLGNPFIFSSTKKYLKNNNYKKINNKNIKKTMIQHAEYFLKYNSSFAKATADKQNLVPLRKQLLQYFKGQKNASEIRQKIIKVKSLEDLKNLSF